MQPSAVLKGQARSPHGTARVRVGSTSLAGPSTSMSGLKKVVSRQYRGAGPKPGTAHAAADGKAQSPMRTRTPAAKAALFTGTYAMIAGFALIVEPIKVFGLLFNPAEVTAGWIRFGGILLALIGMQYWGTGWQDSLLTTPAATTPMSTTSSSLTGPGSGKLAATAGQAQLFSRSFYAATVWSRLFLCTGLTLLVCTGQSPVGMLVLAALNGIGAISMWLALRATDKLLLVPSSTAGPAASDEMDNTLDGINGCNPLGMSA